jgi:GTP-binding protein HflX
LTYTAGGGETFFTKMERPNPKTLLELKIEEIHHFVKENDIFTLVFDCLLHNKKNISKIIMNVKSWIGHTLSLIFCATCRNSYARTQVELAQCQYLPRLSGMWTHLERQKGNWNAWTWGNGD